MDRRSTGLDQSEMNITLRASQCSPSPSQDKAPGRFTTASKASSVRSMGSLSYLTHVLSASTLSTSRRGYSMTHLPVMQPHYGISRKLPPKRNMVLCWSSQLMLLTRQGG